MKIRLAILAVVFASLFTVINTTAKDKQPPKKEVIPHAQDKPPGPAVSPQEALKKMQVPPGFRVELVAAEPDLINPVSMTFDERGRIWITESIEYPRRSAGPGKDRVKLLESTKGDGKFDKVTTVIDGLNIPSGIAVGHGGVWVANSPDILFYPFEDFATPKLGKAQVVVTGFGRDDTHELPNSLTWGPDGWLYGLNGVFNRSVVKHQGKTHTFTCALFRIHPKTKAFEIFCEGTSNPWGLAFNENGDAFVSACVIDHLWHLTETGYYQRQGGAYPPFTWKIGSIVKHRHQKAAYCGLCWFDSDAYPPEYREKMYMGNIHGGCINVDELSRDGSTYAAKPRPDFLTANDAWFMPVAQKVGPDGCMYILDWYDRYHCYQDANRDPAGIDRLHGRLYRVVYKDYKAAGQIKMKYEGSRKWIELLSSPNIYFRETAQRLLTEAIMKCDPKDRVTFDAQLRVYNELTDVARDLAGKQLGVFDGLKDVPKKLARNEKVLRNARLHAFWALSSSDLFPLVLFDLSREKDPTFRAWAVRASANWAKSHRAEDLAHIPALARDESPDVQLQVAIAARKLRDVDPLPVLLDVLTHCGDDKLIPHIVWQNLHPLLEKDGERFLTLAAKVDLAKSPGVAKVLPRAIDRILGNPSGDPVAVLSFIEKVQAQQRELPFEKHSNETARLCLAALSVKVQNNEISGKQLDALRDYLRKGGVNFKIDPRKFDAQLKVAEAEYKLAKAHLAADRATLTYNVAVNKAYRRVAAEKPGTVTKLELQKFQALEDESIAKVALAEAELKLAAANFVMQASPEVEVAILRTLLKDVDGTAQARKLFTQNDYPDESRLRAMAALIGGGDGKQVITLGEPLLRDKKLSAAFRSGYLTGLAPLNDPIVAVQVLRSYADLEPELQPKAIELLTQRPAWAKSLFKEIAAKKISKDVVNVNQARRLLGVKDVELAKLVEKHWGIPRDGRSPEREKIAAQMKELFMKTPSDAKAGVVVFKKLCAQCHKIYGEGVDVGPDITSNGRSDFDQLLSNIFDPSLVIGAGYNAVTVNTKKGQTISGLLVEDNQQRVVLKVQGGELKTIARADVDEQFTSKVSMMPEDLEKQLRPQEIVDLLAYLSLDRPPDDPKARKIPGTPASRAP